MEKIKLAKSCFFHFFKKNLNHSYQQRDGTNEYREVLDMNLNIWFDIPSNYAENFWVNISVAVGIFSERLTDASCQDFSFSFFVVFLWLWLKLMWKVSSDVSLFPDLTCHFLIFLYLCHSPIPCCCWVLFLKQKVVHCVLSFWLVCVMLRSYMLMLFQYLSISSQIEPDVTLCYHCRQTL